jgi:hypothetical protein
MANNQGKRQILNMADNLDKIEGVEKISMRGLILVVMHNVFDKQLMLLRRKDLNMMMSIGELSHCNC